MLLFILKFIKIELVLHLVANNYSLLILSMLFSTVCRSSALLSACLVSGLLSLSTSLPTAHADTSSVLPQIIMETGVVSTERLERVRASMASEDFIRAERDLKLMIGYRDSREVVMFGIESAIKRMDWLLAKERIHYYESKYPQSAVLDEWKSEVYMAERNLLQAFHHVQRAIRLIEEPSAELYERQARLKVAIHGYDSVKNHLLYTAIAEHGFIESFADLLYELATEHNDWNKASSVAERFAASQSNSLKWKLRQSKAYAHTSRTEEAKAVCKMANREIAKRYGVPSSQAGSILNQALDCRHGGLG